MRGGGGGTGGVSKFEPGVPSTVTHRRTQCAMLNESESAAKTDRRIETERPFRDIRQLGSCVRVSYR